MTVCEKNGLETSDREVDSGRRIFGSVCFWRFLLTSYSCISFCYRIVILPSPFCSVATLAI